MEEFIKNFINKIKLQNREETLENIKNKVFQYREWLQNNGEWSLVVGVVGGIILVLFFRALVILTLLAVIASFVIWHISAPDSKN
jgi:uncharacterized membrane protein YjjP (DUF1212 family)